MSEFNNAAPVIACWLIMFLLHRQLLKYEREDEGR